MAEFKYIEMLIFADTEKRMWYRPQWRKFTKTVSATVLLSQIFYWWVKNGQKDFFKQIYKTEKNSLFKTECWLDEMGMNRREFTAALKQISVRRKEKDKDKIDHSQPVVYYVKGRPGEKTRKTFFRIVPENLEKMLEFCYNGGKNIKKENKEQEPKKPQLKYIHPTDLNHFIELYPIKIPGNTEKLKRIWNYLCNLKRDKITWASIVRGLAAHKKYVWADREKKYIPYPSTFLSDRMWQNPVSLKPPKNNLPNPKTKKNLLKIVGKHTFVQLQKKVKSFTGPNVYEQIHKLFCYTKEKQNNEKAFYLIQNLVIPDYVRLSLNFLDWLLTESWITPKTTNKIDPEGKLFSLYIKEKSDKYNILTGRDMYGT